MFKALITEYSKCAERSTFTMHIALSHFHVFTIQNCISNNEILELTTYAVIGYSQFRIRAISLNEIRVKHCYTTVIYQAFLLSLFLLYIYKAWFIFYGPGCDDLRHVVHCDLLPHGLSKSHQTKV